MKKSLLVIVCLQLLVGLCNASQLLPGFSKEEYLELMKLCARHADTSYSNRIPPPQKFKPVYRSPEVGLLNRWDLWVSDDSMAVISIRGTVASKQSWLENFYAAMVPAKGELILSEKDTFRYQVASHPHAAVHVGWMLACGYMAGDIMQKLDSCYRTGIKNVFIMGHSQGGAIAFLLTAYLLHQQMENKIAADVQFKTYCSAAPKPGNLFFAYDYEEMTKGGWAFNVVNSADWVPEVPITIQTATDFNKTNPFVNTKKAIRKSKFPADMVIMYVYNRLYKSPKRAVRKYKKYLGRVASKIVRKDLPSYQTPAFFNSSYYVRTGTTIVLYADAEYYKLFPDSETNIFVHHFFEPYLYLTQKKFKQE